MSPKQIVFGAGVVLQGFILATTLFFFYHMNQEQDSVGAEMGEELPYAESNKGIKLPFKNYVTGVGKVGPSTDYVKVNTSTAGIVDEIFVKIGQKVTANDPLFHINDSGLRHELREKIAAYETALAEFDLLKAGPTTLELTAKEKEIEQVKIQHEQQRKECEIFELLFTKNAVSLSEKEHQQSKCQMVATQIEKVLAEYNHMKEGASAEMREIGKTVVAQKEAALRAAEKKIRDCQVVSPVEGRILNVNINPGAFVGHSDEACITIGSDNPLYLHVFVEEQHAWRVSPTKELRAIAVHRNNPNIHFVLDFVAIKPCLAEGKLELIFSFDKGKAPVYMEQNLDVFIEAASSEDVSYLDYQFSQRRA